MEDLTIAEGGGEGERRLIDLLALPQVKTIGIKSFSTSACLISSNRVDLSWAAAQMLLIG